MRGRWLLLGAVWLGSCDSPPFRRAASPAPVSVPGHYQIARETPGHVAHLALSGDKQLACADCHALDAEGFTSPGPQLCVKCHEAQSAQHHPLAEEQKLSCFTCHAFAAKTSGTQLDEWRCLECHQDPIGGHPAIAVHKAHCGACHRPHQAPFTAAADCKTCHDVRVKHGFKGETMAETCMACHPHHAGAQAASARCASCHETRKVKAAARVEKGALWPEGHAGCGSCHAPHDFVKGAVTPCASCHQTKTLGVEKHSCIGCHDQHATKAAPAACVSCHDKTHAAHGKGLDCASCHEPHAGKAKPGLCADCHGSQVEKTIANVGHQTCKSCHVGLPHNPANEPKACLSCHADKKPPQKGHAQCAACHEDHSARVTMTSCTQCHDKRQLPALHQAKSHAAKCTSCHAPHHPQPGAGPATCLGCHKQLPAATHPTVPQQCVSCHLFKNPSF